MQPTDFPTPGYPEDEPEVDSTFTWEDSFAIARALKERYAEMALEGVSLQMIYTWTLALPGFADDPALANEEILKAIFQEWYEEANPL